MDARTWPWFGMGVSLMARTDSRPHYGQKRRVRGDGYIDRWLPEHPLARRDGYVFEHRLVAWGAGLLTDPDLQVHHRNGDRQDNRIGNLEIMDVAEHASLHAREDGLRGATATNAAKMHCDAGHPFDEANTYWFRSHRICRICNNARGRAYRKRKRQQRSLTPNPAPAQTAGQAKEAAS